MSIPPRQYPTIPPTGPYSWPGENASIETLQDVRNLIEPPLKEMGALIYGNEHGFTGYLPSGAFVIVLFQGPPK